MPKVSIILPVFGEAILLSKAVDSVLNQTYQDYELIIVDDGASRETKKQIENLKKKSLKIKIVRHENNRGVSCARNSGILASKGELITFLSADDELLPRKIEKQAKLFNENGSGKRGIVSVFGKVLLPNGKLSKSYAPELYRGRIFPQILGKNIVVSPMIKRECYDRVGFYDEKLTFGEDWDFHIRVARFYEFDFIPEVLIILRMHRGQLSAKELNRGVCCLRLIDKYKNYYALYPTLRSRVLRYAGSSFLGGGDIKQGRKLLLEGFLVNPLNLQAGIAFILSFGGYKFFKSIMQLRNKFLRGIDQSKKIQS